MGRLAKAPIFPHRNGKTRWYEPAGLARCSHKEVTKLVEAAGIEPASRCISMRTSTGVVDSLRFAISAPHRHGAPMASQKHFLAATVPGVDRDDLDLATDFWASPAKARSQKQPVLGC